MRKLFLIFSSLFLITLYSGCATDDDDTVVVQGVVSDAQNGDGIQNATIQVTNPQELGNIFTRSDSVGQYSLGGIEVNELTELSITAAATDYNPLSRNLQVAEGDNVTNFDFELTAEDDGNDDDDDNDDEGVSGPSSGAAAIILLSISEESINIAETGGIVNTSFTFQVQDSAGRNLDLNNAEEVEFSILSGPGGGEGITPEIVTTNANGTATSNLFSGDSAGVVQIQAEINRENIGLVIRSKPVSITIHGGFPHEDYFSIAAEDYNFEGWSINGNRNPLTVILGDRFGNPVKPGTAVYFTTTGGIIQGSGTGHTDDDGQVIVDLISGDPRPTDTETINGIPFPRPGLATLTARTINEDNEEIEKQVNVVFSSSTAIISATPTTFDLQPNGGASFSYTVTDINGNPMAAGTEISIDAGDGMEVTGDANFSLGNNFFPGPGTTEFQFSIRDTDDQSSDPADLTIKISVTTPSDETTTYSGIQGTRRKAANK